MPFIGGALVQFQWICQEGIKINNVAFVIVILQSCGPSVSSPALLWFHGVQFTGFLQQWSTTPTYIVDLLGNPAILQRMWSRQHHANNMWLGGWLALLGTPRTLCRVGNTSQKKLLNWTLDMQWALCCYQTSIAAMLAAGITVEMSNSNKRSKGMWKNIEIGPGLNGVMTCIHLY